MQQEENRFDSLWKSFNNNQTTEEETREFLALLQQKDAAEVDLLLETLPQQPAATSSPATLPSWEEVNQYITGTEAPGSKNITKSRTWYISAAAVLLLGVAIYLLTPPAGNTTLTAQNQDTYFTLADGSTVILQKGASLTYTKQFNNKVRNVQLSGKAFFDITTNAQKPFTVQTGAVTTTVLGTSFTIDAQPDHKEVLVAVATGKVKVANNNTPAQELEASQALLANTVTSHNTASFITPQQSTAWLSQDLDFNNVSLATVTNKLAARFGVDIQFNDPQLQQRTVSSRLPGNATLTQMLDVLSIATTTSYQLHGKTVIIQKK